MKETCTGFSEGSLYSLTKINRGSAIELITTTGRTSCAVCTDKVTAPERLRSIHSLDWEALINLHEFLS